MTLLAAAALRSARTSLRLTALRSGQPGLQCPLSGSSARVCTPPASARRLHATARARAQSGLTNLLADVAAPPVLVRRMGAAGIELEDGLVLPGACVFLEGRVFLWDVPDAESGSGSGSASGSGGGGAVWAGLSGAEVRARFELFEVVVPRPEILILGTGDRVRLPPPALRQHLNKLGIQLDVMDTWNACSTYNLLAEEGRRVAAALIPSPPRAWARHA